MSSSRTTLLAFHGFSLNGATLRAQLGPLGDELSAHVDLVCPDAPHPCSEASVAALYRVMNSARLPPPYLSWWDASDDGSVYEGWTETLALVRGLMEQHAPLGVLGFSQGAILAAAIAALAARGELPALRFAVLIAGRTPRSRVLAPYFEATIAVPTLHVWGNRDKFAVPQARELLEKFDPHVAEACIWRGAHIIPTRGPGAAAIGDFVKHYA